MILAELELFHSRPIAPTRRVALGDSHLPCDPAPGFGGILLGAVAAADAHRLTDEVQADLVRLTRELEEGRRIPQPRLAFRLQGDRVGLLRTRVRLIDAGGALRLDADEERSLPAQRVLAACYAAGRLPVQARRPVFAALRRGLRWAGPVSPALFLTLAGVGGGQPLSTAALTDPVGWALDTLGFDAIVLDGLDGLPLPERGEVVARFRRLLRLAHPDHGGDRSAAAQRIADLREARRILLAA